jgi:Rps23 Pro-64 3,4-dihydroxylase Tpa1-like proline 4-hydroxylase
VIDYPQMWRQADSLKEQYGAASPFEHVVIDDFLPAPMISDLLESFPEYGSDAWKLSENEHTANKRDLRYIAGMSKDITFGAARWVFHELNSGSFLEVLRRLTGLILLPDPYFIEGGFHLVGNGGRLAPHADFSHHQLGMERRVNLLLYLNVGWKPEYGGDLKLYDQQVRPVRSIAPLFNRCVIFNTSRTSYHGHPEPMRLPDGVWRRSLAMYYYTAPSGRQSHKAIFPRAP